MEMERPIEYENKSLEQTTYISNKKSNSEINIKKKESSRNENSNLNKPPKTINISNKPDINQNNTHTVSSRKKQIKLKPMPNKTKQHTISQQLTENSIKNIIETKDSESKDSKLKKKSECDIKKTNTLAKDKHIVKDHSKSIVFSNYSIPKFLDALPKTSNLYPSLSENTEQDQTHYTQSTYQPSAPSIELQKNKCKFKKICDQEEKSIVRETINNKVNNKDNDKNNDKSNDKIINLIDSCVEEKINSKMNYINERLNSIDRSVNINEDFKLKKDTEIQKKQYAEIQHQQFIELQKQKFIELQKNHKENTQDAKNETNEDKKINEKSDENIFLNDDNIEVTMSNHEFVNNMDIFSIPVDERDEVIDFAKDFLNIDLLKYPELAGKVIHCITAPLPPNWEKIEDKDGDYYYCQELNISQYSHPLDFYYRKYLKDEKKKLKKGCIVM